MPKRFLLFICSVIFVHVCRSATEAGCEARADIIFTLMYLVIATFQNLFLLTFVVCETSKRMCVHVYV